MTYFEQWDVCKMQFRVREKEENLFLAGWCDCISPEILMMEVRAQLVKLVLKKVRK